MYFIHVIIITSILKPNFINTQHFLLFSCIPNISNVSPNLVSDKLDIFLEHIDYVHVQKKEVRKSSMYQISKNNSEKMRKENN